LPTRRGRKVLVAQVLGQVFMKRAFEDPFGSIEAALRTLSARRHGAGGLVDMHCEATSEKMAMGHFCDGRASVVVGTHTHVPTADAMILPRHRLPDRCGHVRRLPLRHRDGEGRAAAPLRHRHGQERFSPALGEATLSGLYVETDDATGKAVRVQPIREGGVLRQTAP
jgi:calcineurin-like phosphoesterase